MRVILAALTLFAAAPSSSYPQTRAAVETRRAELARAWTRATPATRAAVLGSARAAAFHAFVDEIIPAWNGTPWAFYGTSETPGEGTIACGYFVSTVLRDGGLAVERAPLAQQPSERIVRTLAPAGKIQRFRDVAASEVVRRVRASGGDGLYVVGMDFHVGFLVLEGERADLCHSAFVPPAHVTCEPAATSPGFQSRYYVVGPVLDDARVIDWLEGNAVPTF